MKINFVIGRMALSGGTRAIFEIANGLEKRGHEVVLISPILPNGYFYKDDRTWLNPRKIAGALRRRYKTSEGNWFNFDAKVKRVPYLYHDSIFLNKFVPDADATIATGWMTAYQVNALKESKGEKYYFVQHYEAWNLWQKEKYWSKARSRGDPKLEMVNIEPDEKEDKKLKEMVEKTYSFDLKKIVNSEWEEKFLSELGEKSYGRIDLGVNQELFSFSSTQENDKVELLSLSRGRLEKGEKELLEVYNKLDNSNLDIKLSLFGEEKSEDMPESVDFYQNPSDQELAELYSRSDIFFYPSRIESYGMPPLEAMACETVIVSTDVGAVSHYGTDIGVHTVPIMDPNKALQKIRDLYGCEKMNEMKQENKRKANEFLWEKTAKQFENIISGNKAGQE